MKSYDSEKIIKEIVEHYQKQDLQPLRERRDYGKVTAYIKVRDQKKIERVQRLEQSIGQLKKQVSKDLKSKDQKTRMIALIVRLIDSTYERVGNEESADNGHYGITGLRKKHITFNNGEAIIKYIGKSGVQQEKRVNDSSTISALKEAVQDKGNEDRIFNSDLGKITRKHVNKYLEPFQITSKDIRGFYANKVMKQVLNDIKKKRKNNFPDNIKDRNKLQDEEFKKALEETAKIIGHKPSTLRTHYLLPDFERKNKKEYIEEFQKENK